MKTFAQTSGWLYAEVCPQCRTLLPAGSMSAVGTWFTNGYCRCSACNFVGTYADFGKATHERNVAIADRKLANVAGAGI